MEKKRLKIPFSLPGQEECSLCAGRLRASLLESRGVTAADIDCSTYTLTIDYDPIITSVEDIEKRAGEVGLELSRRFGHRTLNLAGLDCPDCAQTIEKGLKHINGVLWASVNFAASRMSVEYESDKVGIEQIISKVRSLGYEVIEEADRVREKVSGEIERLRTRGMFIVTTLSGIFLLSGFLASLFGYPNVSILLYLSAIVIGGYRFAWKGLLALRGLSLDMNFLMTIAVIGAAAIGEWSEGATVAFLFSLAGLLESLSMERARRAIRSLMELSPKEALVKRDGTETRVPVEEVKTGEELIVAPGERVPLDGVIVAGASSLNQAPITGESMPVEKGTGDIVYAGSINGYGSLIIRATRPFKDTILSKVIHMVEEAQAKKASSQRFVDTFARYYTPAVIALAIGVAIIPVLVFNQPFSAWLYRGLVLLVISCPCALVISTPVTIVSGLARAAQAGVLIKGGRYLEDAGRHKVVAFDKTGTLTEGLPIVTDIITLNTNPPEVLLQIAASVEARSEHPIAQAILSEAEKKGISYTPADDFRALPGGAMARINGEEYYAAGIRYLSDKGADVTGAERIVDRLEEEGKTTLLLARGAEVLGVIGVMDKIRQEAKETVNKLHSIDVKKIVMITGDNERVARTVAGRLGIDDYRAGFTPEEKVKAINGLSKVYGKVMMVGDGVNDAPALAASSIGIAMGGIGTDVALETADIVLMSDDLSRLPFVITLSRKALALIKENLALSIGIKGLFLILALFGLATIWMAIAADMGASLLVIANGMRLLNHGET